MTVLETEDTPPHMRVALFACAVAIGALGFQFAPAVRTAMASATDGLALGAFAIVVAGLVGLHRAGASWGDLGVAGLVVVAPYLYRSVALGTGASAPSSLSTLPWLNALVISPFVVFPFLLGAVVAASALNLVTSSG